MALIECPECGGKISDKAPACIHCGFPLDLLNSKQELTNNVPNNEENNASNEIKYSLELLDYGNKKVQIALALKNTLNMNDVEALELVGKAPCYLFRDKPESIVSTIIKKLNSMPIEYNLYYNNNLKRHKTKTEIDIVANTSVTSGRTTTNTNKHSGQLQCPNCQSFIPETSRVCPECGFDGIGSYLLQLERNKKHKVIDCTHNYDPIIPKAPNVPKCPTCQSTDIRKVSSVSKLGSAIVLGLLSQKIKKTYHCNNCGYEW